jgi:hypothetical protein
MSGSYRHFIEPGRKETRGSDIYSLARRLLANGTIHSETRLETWRLAVTQDTFASDGQNLGLRFSGT